MKKNAGVVLGLLMLSIAATSFSAPLFVDHFDGYAVGDVPTEWTVITTNGLEVFVTNNVFQSSPNSLLFVKTIASGAGRSAIRPFPAVTGGILRVTYHARSTQSNHDALYVKLRNAAHSEMGGLRFSTTGTIQYQLPNATWTNTGSNYSANVWYNFRIDFNLDTYTYSAWVDGNPLVADAAFRTNTSTAGSLIVQDRLATTGLGNSFLDNVSVEHLTATGTIAILKFDRSTGGLVFEWDSQTNKSYALYQSTQMAARDLFSVAYSNIPGTPPVNVFTASLSTAETEFWFVAEQ